MTEEFEQQEPAEVKLIVTEEMRSYLYDITKWAKFLSIIGFIFAAMLILIAFSIPSLMSNTPGLAKQLGALGQGGSTMITILYVLLGLFYFYPSVLLSKISNNGKQGVLFGDQESLNTAIASLKSLFKFWGIVTIIVIASYFLLVFLVAGGMAGA